MGSVTLVAIMTSPTLRLCLIDMNNGVANQAVRCFQRIIDQFKTRVQAANPGLEITFQHVQPRNLGELPSPDADLILSSGGPGSPYDGFEDPWAKGFRACLDGVVERTLRGEPGAPAVLAVCHSFQLAVMHFQVARMGERPGGRKFGVMPIYLTKEGQETPLFEPFGDRLFAWEHRFWEAIDLDEARLRNLGGHVLARESREGRTDKGPALLAMAFAPGVVGTQFHPEADRAGVEAWVFDPVHADEFKTAYGEDLYNRMVLTLKDPARVDRTFALVVPGWLEAQFNRLAADRGYHAIPEINLQSILQEPIVVKG